MWLFSLVADDKICKGLLKHDNIDVCYIKVSFKKVKKFQGCFIMRMMIRMTDDDKNLDGRKSRSTSKGKQNWAEGWKAPIVFGNPGKCWEFWPFPKSVKLEGLGWLASQPGWGEAWPGHEDTFWKYLSLDIYKYWVNIMSILRQYIESILFQHIDKSAHLVITAIGVSNI